MYGQQSWVGVLALFQRRGIEILAWSLLFVIIVVLVLGRPVSQDILQEGESVFGFNLLSLNDVG